MNVHAKKLLQKKNIFTVFFSFEKYWLDNLAYSIFYGCHSYIYIYLNCRIFIANIYQSLFDIRLKKVANIYIYKKKTHNFRFLHNYTFKNAYLRGFFVYFSLCSSFYMSNYGIHSQRGKHIRSVLEIKRQNFTFFAPGFEKSSTLKP